MRFLKNLPSLKFLMAEALRTSLRFPFPLTSAVLAMAYSTYAIESKISFDDSKLVFTLALGIPLFFASTLLRESKNWIKPYHRTIELLVGTLLLASHYFLTANDTTDNYFLRYMQLSLALHLLVAFIAFLGQNKDHEFWQFNRHLFLRILLSSLYAGVFYGGVVIALITIDQLLEFKIESKRYLELWLFSVFVIQSWHFLTGVPELSNLKNETTYPKGLRLFVQFLLIPMVSLYMAILYIYMTKILVTWIWPRGYIAWLVSIMSVLGIFNLLLIDPEKDKMESRWIQGYSKFYYILILPLIGMLFIAIGKRVSEYGITEQRYFLMVLGSLLAGLAIYFIFSKKKNIKVIPVSLFAVVVLSLWGPWSAYSVSLRHQKARAQKLMQRYGLLVEGKAKAANVSVDFKDEKQLSSIFDYIIRNHGSQAIRDWFPNYGGSTQISKSQNAQMLMEQLGLKYVDRWERDTKRTFYFHSEINKGSFSIKGFENALLYEFYVHRGENQKTLFLSGRNYSVGFENSPPTIVIRENHDRVISIPLKELIEKLLAQRKDETSEDDPPVRLDLMTIEAKSDTLKIKVLVKDLRGELKDGLPFITLWNGIILIN